MTEQELFDKIKSMSIFEDSFVDAIQHGKLSNIVAFANDVERLGTNRFIKLSSINTSIAVCNIVVDWSEIDTGKPLMHCVYVDMIVVSNQSIVCNTHTCILNLLGFIMTHANSLDNVSIIDEKAFSDAYKAAKLEVEKHFFYMKDDTPRLDSTQLSDMVKHFKVVVDSVLSEAKPQQS